MMPGKLTFKLQIGAADDEVHEVYQGNEYIGMVCRHLKTKKWAATWNMIPTSSDDFPFDTKLDASDVLVAQTRRMRFR
jgi:hypothetical protein